MEQLVAQLLTWWRARRELALQLLAKRLPRELVYLAGVRILNEVTRRDELTKVGREVHQGEIRMLHALQTFANGRK